MILIEIIGVIFAFLEVMIASEILNLSYFMRFLLDVNSFGPAVSVFLRPLLLILPENKIDVLTAVQAALPTLNLTITVFGYSVTKDVCFSLIISLVFSASGQIYNIYTKGSNNN